MTGAPIPGEHWVKVSFKEEVTRVDSVKITWEKADSNDWVVEYLGGGGEWEGIYDSREGKHGRIKVSDTVLVDEVKELGRRGEIRGGTKEVRLRIRKPNTRWGTSVWNWEIVGA
ncbi:hypothetical protein TrRE_jg6707 [Triparma retinervis]|uniref:Uncharacterized protein n=1 Tax=Triparma retinervis TaxID=2557542 RepID=A0A9W7E2B4_9STRA|nr:hypothetical protein TrRE_jg6707 [Triparma retinervis]